MDIVHENTTQDGAFILMNNGEQLGLMAYRWICEDQFNIVHTEVSPEHQGQGLAKKLLNAAVDYARSENKKIRATCSYAKAVLESDKLYADVYV